MGTFKGFASAIIDVDSIKAVGHGGDEERRSIWIALSGMHEYVVLYDEPRVDFIKWWNDAHPEAQL